MDGISLGLFITKRRKELGLSQNDIAEFLSVSSSSVYKWEKGDRIPDLSLIGKICNILEIDIESFFNEETSLNNNYCKENEFNQFEFAKHFNILRKMNGYSLVSLAEELDVTYQTISKWENAESMPNVFLFKKCADIFKVPLYEIYFGKKFEIKEADVVLKKSYTPIIVLSIAALLLLGSAGLFITDRIMARNNEDIITAYQNEVRVTYIFDKILDPVTLLIYKGETVEKYIPNIEGYDFSYFVNGKEFNFDTLLYADTIINCYLNIKQFNVYFYDQHDSVLSHQVVDYGNSAIEPEIVLEEEYLEFYGWSCDFDNVKSHLEVYPVIINKTADITLDPNGGQCDVEYIYDYNGYDDLPIPYKKGHRFLGWYHNGKLFTRDTKVYTPIILEARYEANTYKITLVEENKTSTMEVIYGTEITLLDSIVENKVFVGWFLNGEKVNSTFVYDYDYDITLEAKYGSVDSDYTYVDLGDSISLVKYNGDEINIVLPSRIDDKVVTQVEASLFDENCSFVKSIVLPDSIKTYSIGCFENLVNLEKMYITTSTRGKLIEMFNGNVPSNFKTIEVSSSLNGDTSNVLFDKFEDYHLKVIVQKDVTKLTGTYYKNYVEELHFFGNTEYSLGTTGSNDFLKKVSFSDNTITTIPKNAFNNCSILEEVRLPNGLTEIGNYAFYNNKSLSIVNFPNSLTRIGFYSFSMCALNEIHITSNVEKVIDYAFVNCSSLTKVYIESIDVKFSRSVFSKSENIEEVYYSGTKEDWMNLTFDDKYANPLCYGAKLFIDNKEVVDEEVLKHGL